MEEKELQQEQQLQEEQKGWHGAFLDPNMPLNMIINFLNILNDRLCFIEDRLQVSEGVTISDFYTEQMKTQAEEMKKMQEEQSKENE